MKDIIKVLEGLPWIVRILLTIFLDLYNNIIRLCRSIQKNSILGIVLAIILIATGGLFILWIIDLFTVLFNKKIWWID